MIANTGIYRTYDIRGLYGQDFDDEFAFRLGRGLVKYFNSKVILVSKDLRESSAAIKQKVIEGVASMGAEAIDIGETSTPLFYWAAQHFGAHGGVMVTASHLPEQYNGFKVINAIGMNIGLDSGLKDLQKVIEGDAGTIESGGKTWPAERVVEEHSKFLMHLAKIKAGQVKLKVGIDGNSIIAREFGDILKKLEIGVVPSGYDILFAFDADGDRLMVHNQFNERIRGDLIMALLAKEKMSWWRKPTVVYDFRSSRGVIDDLSHSGLKLFPAPVGHTLIKAIMRQHGADLAGELSGHIFFKETSYAESTYLAALKVLKLMQKFGVSIDNLVKPFETWSHSGEINFKLKAARDKDKILAQLKGKYTDGQIKEFDGLTVNYPDWWFNARLSMNEPTLRLVVEAKTKEVMDQKVMEISELIKNAMI